MDGKGLSDMFSVAKQMRLATKLRVERAKRQRLEKKLKEKEKTR